MILQIQTTLKLYGEVDIVWIRKYKNSVYLSMSIKILISLILSISIKYVLSDISHMHTEKSNEIFLKQEHENIERFVDKVQDQITKMKLTYKQVRNINFNEGNRFDIEFFIYSTINFDELNLEESDIKYIYKIEYEDTIGLATITLYKIKMTAKLYSTMIKIGSSVLFLVSTIYIIFKELSYIKTITKGIKQISNGDLTYKIPIKGSNELSCLACNINSMGSMIHDKIQNEKQYEINQRALITNMSHDLKTPLTSMIGYIDILQNKLSTEDELYQYANIAKKNGVRLEKLIGDLFLYSKLLSEDIPINLNTFDINIVLKQIFEIKTENIVYKERYKYLEAIIDIEKFNRVIDNLISNASIYGIENEPILVSTEIRGKFIEIIITNHTNEDLDDKIDMLKNRLYTGSEDRSNGSSGLGLAIVSELLKTMDATIDLVFENKEFSAIIRIPKA